MNASRPPPSLLRHRDFLLLWGGQTVSELGSAVTLLALPLVAVAVLHASTLQVGLLGTAATLPYLLVTLPAGALVDRMPRRATLLWADVGRAALLGSVPLAAAVGALGMPQLYAVAIAAGVLGVFFDVAYLSYLPALVPRALLADGNGKLQTTHAVARISGSGLGGGLAALLGPAGSVAADAASYLVSVASLLAVRAREPVRTGRRPRPDMRAEIAEGLRFTWQDRILRAVMLSGAHSLVFSSMSMALLVLFLVRDLHGGPVTVGVVAAVGGAGGLAGGLLAGRIARRVGTARVLWLSKLWFTSGFALLPLARGPWGAALAALAGAVGNSGVAVYNTAQVTYRQASCPPRLLGRLNATMRWVMWGAMPLGATLGGLLGAAIGVRATLAVAGAGAVLSAGWLLHSPLRALRDLPDPPPLPGGTAADAGHAGQPDWTGST